MMKTRLLLGITLGAWMAGTLFMWLVAMKNFAVVERVLANPPAGLESSVTPLPVENLRPAMRYQASEVNRLFFAGWGLAQIPIAAIMLLLAWVSKQGGGFRAVTLIALLIALFLQLHVVPETIRLGEMMDFDRPVAEVEQTFWSYHQAYTGLDALKLFLLIGCGIVLVRKG